MMKYLSLETTERKTKCINYLLSLCQFHFLNKVSHCTLILREELFTTLMFQSNAEGPAHTANPNECADCLSCGGGSICCWGSGSFTPASSPHGGTSVTDSVTFTPHPPPGGGRGEEASFFCIIISFFKYRSSSHQWSYNSGRMKT